MNFLQRLVAGDLPRHMAITSFSVSASSVWAAKATGTSPQRSSGLRTTAASADAGVRRGCALDLGRVDVFRARADRVFDPAEEIEAAVGVAAEHVAPARLLTLDVTRMERLTWDRWTLRVGTALIVGFADKRTEDFYRGRRVAAFSGFVRAASRTLDQFDAATGLRDLSRRATGSKPSRAAARGSGASGSTTGGGSVSSGRKGVSVRPGWKFVDYH